jgi:hypothetical protein
MHKIIRIYVWCMVCGEHLLFWEGTNYLSSLACAYSYQGSRLSPCPVCRSRCYIFVLSSVVQRQ